MSRRRRRRANRLSIAVIAAVLSVIGIGATVSNANQPQPTVPAAKPTDVPEPAGLGLLTLSGVAMLLRRRRR